jgi:putative spermidine/putrescine transport system permease protein
MSAAGENDFLPIQGGSPAASGRRSPAWLIAPGAAFLFILMVFPVLQLLSVSLRDPVAGAWSLAAYSKIFATSLYLRILTTTFALAIETTALSLALGYPLAYWLARKSQQGNGLVILLALIPLWASSLIKNFVWLVLLGRTGVAIKIAVLLGARPGTEFLYHHATVLFAMVGTMLPGAVITMLPTMLKLDRQLPEAAATLGASNAHAFWRVFFPLSMPGVAAAGLLVLVVSLGFFVTPTLLGSPRETMIGQVIISQILALHNWPFGAALASILILTTLIACLIYNRLFGLTAVSGAANGPHRPDSLTRRTGVALFKRIATAQATLFERSSHRRAATRSDWPLNIYAALVILMLFLPILALLPMAFTTSSFLSFPPPLFTGKWFSAYAQSPIWIAATLRSFGIGAACAFLTFLITFPAAYGVARTGGRIATATFLLFMAPMIIPSIGLSLALFYLLSQLKLVATDIGVILGHTVLAIPTVFVIALATMKSHDWRLNDAAATLGADKWRTTLRVTLPLMKGGLLASMIFAFLLSFDELTVVMFVGAGFKTTLPKQMWDGIQLQLDPTLAAASLFVLLIAIVLFLVAERLQPRR